MRKSKENSIDIKIAKYRLREIEKKECINQTKDEFLKEMEFWVNK